VRVYVSGNTSLVDWHRLLQPIFIRSPTLTPIRPASSSRISGVIKSTDATARTVTLATGRIYHSEVKMDLSQLKSGDEVTVTYTEADGKMNTSDVTLTK